MREHHFMDHKQMPLAVPLKSISRQFVLLRRHISAPVLCDNITLNGSNEDNQDTQLWTGTVGHDLGCHLGPSSRGTLRCWRLHVDVTANTTRICGSE